MGCKERRDVSIEVYWKFGTSYFLHQFGMQIILILSLAKSVVIADESYFLVGFSCVLKDRQPEYYVPQFFSVLVCWPQSFCATTSYFIYINSTHIRPLNGLDSRTDLQKMLFKFLNFLIEIDVGELRVGRHSNFCKATPRPICSFQITSETLFVAFDHFQHHRAWND